MFVFYGLIKGQTKVGKKQGWFNNGCSTRVQLGFKKKKKVSFQEGSKKRVQSRVEKVVEKNSKRFPKRFKTFFKKRVQKMVQKKGSENWVQESAQKKTPRPVNAQHN